MKNTELTAVLRGRCAEEPSPEENVIPVIKDRYAGSSGRTHGEKNDKIPAVKAARTESWSIFYRYFRVIILALPRRAGWKDIFPPCPEV